MGGATSTAGYASGVAGSSMGAPSVDSERPLEPSQDVQGLGTATPSKARGGGAGLMAAHPSGTEAAGQFSGK